MGILGHIGAFAASAAVTYTLSAIFYTQQVLAKQFAIGAVYSLEQQASAYVQNFIGLAPAFGVVLAIALLLGFIVSAIVKRIIRPLAPIAYPVAGAAAVFTAIWLIDNTLGKGGAGAIGGARDALGLGLQCLAGFAGGVVFSLLRPRIRR